MKNHRFLRVTLAALLLMGTVGLFGCAGEDAAEAPAPDTPAETPAPEGLSAGLSEYFVTVDELEGMLGEVDIVDARGDEAFEAGHIPGAVPVVWQAFAAVADGGPGDPEWGVLLPADEIAAVLGGLGIDGEREIIVYSDPAGWGESGRIVWMLRMAGLDASRMLDGGFPAWQAAGLEVARGPVETEPAEVSIASLDHASWNATADEIAGNLDGLTLVDSRARVEFDGATEFGEARGGHIPGAVSVPYLDLFEDDGTLKAEADLIALFEEAGVQRGDDIVVYCTKGIRSGFMALVIRGIGFDGARNYDASFYEWAGDEALEVE